MAKQPALSKSRSPEIIVFWTRRTSLCNDCGDELEPGSFIPLRGDVALCLECADLHHLVFLPRGDTALTRRATKNSGLRAVVVRWATARKRYERQGILVEEEALQQAEMECEADAERRATRRARTAVQLDQADRAYVERFAAAIRERYPHCPEGAELEIARHACSKYSGRVGRSGAAKRFDAEAIDLAVRAHVRHRHTDYDDLLMKGWERNDARLAVGSAVDQVLATWQAGS